MLQLRLSLCKSWHLSEYFDNKKKRIARTRQQRNIPSSFNRIAPTHNPSQRFTPSLSSWLDFLWHTMYSMLFFGMSLLAHCSNDKRFCSAEGFLSYQYPNAFSNQNKSEKKLYMCVGVCACMLCILTDNIQTKCHRHLGLCIHLTLINARITCLRKLYL